jgi:signal peptidase I
MASIQEAKRSSRWIKIPLVIFAVILAIPVFSPFGFRAFLFQPFKISAGSMLPTLLTGDYLFVSKYAYGYTQYSLPFAPRLFSGRIFSSVPARGDVIVFRTPRNESIDYIKRVVGLPGDRIQMKQGLLYINGTAVVRERLPDFVDGDACGESADTRIRRWRETLPNGASYETLDCFDNGFYDNTDVYTVPADHIFVLGDNRDNSIDSRLLLAMGYIPLDHIVGRAGLIFYSIAHASAIAQPAVRSERIGQIVH